MVTRKTLVPTGIFALVNALMGLPVVGHCFTNLTLEVSTTFCDFRAVRKAAGTTHLFATVCSFFGNQFPTERFAFLLIVPILVDRTVHDQVVARPETLYVAFTVPETSPM